MVCVAVFFISDAAFMLRHGAQLQGRSSRPRSTHRQQRRQTSTMTSVSGGISR